LLPDTLDLYYFPVLLATSLLGCILGTYSRPPTEWYVLKEFYRNVRPWGFWKPVQDALQAEGNYTPPNKEFGWDMLNVFLGIVAQTSLVILPIYLIFRQSTPLYIALGILLICLFFLKKFWWDRLGEKLS
jgi:hypothetical protein